MRGTMICGVTDTHEGREALNVGLELSGRLGLRLVLVHVADGISPIGSDGDGQESVTMKANREGGARVVEKLAAEYGLAETVERRTAVGEPAVVLGQIAAEEAADVILVGGRARGRLRRGFESPIANELETETPVPVLIAPPRTRRGRRVAAMNGERR